MKRPAARPVPEISKADARGMFMHAQRLDLRTPFGAGPESTKAAVEHLGYVQIDTIHVVERCHHHILYSRIPDYRRDDLRRAQSVDKTVFEYWTHALAYVPTRDISFFLPAMKQHRLTPDKWFASEATQADLKKALARIRKDGPLSIRDVDDDELVEKDHPWASRKPTKRALQLAFYNGLVAISARQGMLKTYELFDRHFGWDKPPRPASDAQISDYVLNRALTAQGLVSLDSICHLDARRKPAIRALIEKKLRKKELVPVAVEGADRTEHWLRPETLESGRGQENELVHILSPFDPLIIQRKRLSLFFGYDHRFEAYVPADKRVFGYFALPVLIGDEVVAAIDMKTDRQNKKLQIRKWSWIGGKSAERKKMIEEEIGRFERFQLAAAED